MAERLPVAWLNFPGDVTPVDRERAWGPTDNPNFPPTALHGTEYLYAVAEEYDPEADRTRVGFSYIAPEADHG
jgi:hypothetical protein